MAMKIEYVICELLPVTLLNRRVGKNPRISALLKVAFEDGTIGFANLHPNPERLGNTLEQELQRLREGNPSLQGRLSLRMAKIDARARGQNKSLWSDVKIPPCHLLITEPEVTSIDDIHAAMERRFRKFKIKVGRNWKREIEILNEWAPLVPPGSLRPDWNQALDTKQLQEFCARAQPALIDAIDFVEDPTVDRPEVWSQYSTKIRWAWDQHSEKITKEDRGFSAVVVKPAIQDVDLMSLLLADLDVQVAFTSYMDHPVGQMGAAWVAAKFYDDHPQKEIPCGLASHNIFALNRYSECLRTKGPQLFAPEGAGIGFGELLEKENWKKLH